jgi:hypothetical protein
MPAVHALSLTLQIDRLAKGHYQAELGGGTITRMGELSVYDTIANAIRGEAEDMPEGLCYFVDVHYGGLSSGSIPVGVLHGRADEIAKHLVDLIADFKLIHAS